MENKYYKTQNGYASSNNTIVGAVEITEKEFLLGVEENKKTNRNRMKDEIEKQLTERNKKKDILVSRLEEKLGKETVNDLLELINL